MEETLVTFANSIFISALVWFLGTLVISLFLETVFIIMVLGFNP